MPDPVASDFPAIAKAMREIEAQRIEALNTPAPDEAAAQPVATEPINYTWGNVYAPVAFAIRRYCE